MRRTGIHVLLVVVVMWLASFVYLFLWISSDGRDCVKELELANGWRQTNVRYNVGFSEINKADSTPLPSRGQPCSDYENVSRKLDDGLTEIWYYLRAELKTLEKSMTSEEDRVKVRQILDNGGEQLRSVMTDLQTLRAVDGYSPWRQRESEELSRLVQRRLTYLQNPANCSASRRVFCEMKSCGFGCQLHHLTYCLIVAYATQRTLVVDSVSWSYSSDGLEAVFQPLSYTCAPVSNHQRQLLKNAPLIKANVDDEQIVKLDIIDFHPYRPNYLPPAIPADLADRLTRLHGYPLVWWIGQHARYLMRPKRWLVKDILEKTMKLGFQHPIVGVHVRRTDKLRREASFHAIEEYMHHVEEYFLRLERTQTVPVRRVYLATDDPKLLEEAKMKYPQYVFVSDIAISRSASLEKRYSKDALRGLLIDLHFLSQSDFIVCTFSSAVCRLAYELMQTLHPDASARFRSLDDHYYYGGQNPHNLTARYAHVPQNKDEIELLPGDPVAVEGNHWDGYSLGMNQRTKQRGLYPSYKVGYVNTVAEMPTYPDA